MDQILSVCTGIGGLDLGLHAGLRAVGREPRTVCMVEREAFPCAVLGKAIEEGWMDDAPIWLGDLRDLPLHELPAIDWYTGGYPCQPFSQAGRRMGGDDPRHLWPVILRQLKSLRPRGVFFENVSGHLSLGLDRVLQDLAGCGFSCAFGLFTAEEIGAPHRRERVFILGLAHCDDGRLPIVGQAHDSDRGVSHGHDADRRSQNVAYSDQSRLEGDLCDADPKGREKEGRPAAGCGGDRGWPARPGRPQNPWEPSRTVAPMGRESDGLPDRVDRLRALGNGVVPQQAAHAFITLYEELTR